MRCSLFDLSQNLLHESQDFTLRLVYSQNISLAIVQTLARYHKHVCVHFCEEILNITILKGFCDKNVINEYKVV
jgi:hypothetical protein